MCGINGIFDLKHKNSCSENYELVHQMNEKIIYRGPNHEGMFQDDNLTMGMRRLAILDLKSGNQPIYNENQSIVIVFNGEIYNFNTIKSDLTRKGHMFRTHTDTEVIVHGYEEYGEKIFEQLDGMFAISLFDRKQKKLLLARDRMGEKPLYFYHNSEWVIWGSELKSIIGTGIVQKEIDRYALNLYFQLCYIPAPLTIYQNVYKVMPGHYVVVGDGQCEDRQYWNLRDIQQNENMTYDDAKAQLKSLVKESIQERMVSDVPIGAFLSGGLDSSVVVSLMSEMSNQPINTFTMGFQEKEYDERSRANLIVQKNHTNHHEYILNYDDVLNKIDDILEHVDEPFADPSIIPTYFVSQFAASQKVKVVLTGDAGDELFLGYSKYLINYYSDLFHKYPKFMQNGFRNLVMHLPDRSSMTRKVRKVLNCCDMDLYDQRKVLMSLGYKENERRQLLNPEYYVDNAMDFLDDIYYGIEGSEWHKTQYMDLSVVLEGDMLAKVDRMSMLHSLETRTPLLSRKIVEFAFSLPDEYKIKGKDLKHIFKDTFEPILPKEFSKLPKSGFGIPLDHWFRHQLKEWVQDILEPVKLEKQGIVNADYVKEVLDKHFTGQTNYGRHIWSLIVFEKWYEKEKIA